MFWLGCKGGFSAFWWPSVEIYGHMHFPKIMFLLPSKSKHPLYYIHCQESEFAFFPDGGHLESKCLSIGLCLQWEPLTWWSKPISPIISREIYKRPRLELCTVPTFLIWSLQSRLVYWSMYFSFLTYEKYMNTA